MTWLQPPGHVHAMIDQSWQDMAVNFTLNGDCGNLNITAGDVAVVASADGSDATVRVVNLENSSIQIDIITDNTSESIAQVVVQSSYSLLEGSACASTPAFPYYSEHAKCANTPGQPNLFEPTDWVVVPRGEAVLLPGYSFIAIRLKLN
eukprot:SAG31_NODE_3095_length_4682_cov_2.946542_6_plen_149_part_00